MSFKAKNLSFHDSDPPFLKKLQGGYDESAERHTRHPTRPSKKLIDGDDDEPTYVDSESNDVLSRAEAEQLLGKSTAEPGDKVTEDASNTDAAPVKPDDKAVKEQPVGKIGGSGKRKLGKVVGDGDEDEGRGESATKPKPKPTKQKAAKKSKIKLSFDEA